MEAQQEWLVQVVVRATSDEVEQIAERIGQAMCQPTDHEGDCVTPWTLVRVPVADLDEPERTGWVELLDPA